MSRMISRYLKDFGAEPSAPAPVAAVMPAMAFDDAMSFTAAPAQETLVDLAAERREAYAEGHEAATLSLTELHQAEIDAVMIAHEAALEELKAHFETAAIERIDACIAEMANAIGIAVSAEVAKPLSTIMTETVTAKAVEELAALVTASILDGAVGTITVSGRRAMFDSLAAKVHPDGVLLAFVESQDVDLSVTIGDTVLVTRMSAWADSLRDVLS